MAIKKSAPAHADAGPGDTCPECRVNHVDAPFDYCSMCEMLFSYYQINLATPEQLQDRRLFTEAFERWRTVLTWAQIEKLRDEYWPTRRQAQARSQM